MTQSLDLEKKELLDLHKYFHFISWLIEEGWEPYWIGYEIYINTSTPGNPIRNINKLYVEYLRQLPGEGDEPKEPTEQTDPRQEAWQ